MTISGPILSHPLPSFSLSLSLLLVHFHLESSTLTRPLNEDQSRTVCDLLLFRILGADLLVVLQKTVYKNSQAGKIMFLESYLRQLQVTFKLEAICTSIDRQKPLTVKNNVPDRTLSSIVKS